VIGAGGFPSLGQAEEFIKSPLEVEVSSIFLDDDFEDVN
jgi:hypothetical protein